MRRFKIRAKGKTEFRIKGKAKCEEALKSGTSVWSKSNPITDYIDDVSAPAINAARLRSNTKSRYHLAITQLRGKLKGFTIADAVKFRTLERILKEIAQTHGSESARQARTVLSKYILDQLIREELIEHNPIRGIAIDLGDNNKSGKASGGRAITDADYEAVVNHLVTRDTARPLPPGTDMRATSIAKHRNVVALALLQSGTGLRISEALALTRSDAATTAESITLTVTEEVSKTHRARSVPILDKRVESWWRTRLEALPANPDTPLIPSPGDAQRHWRTDNAVKACALLYKDVGQELGNQTVAELRSHAWRTILNNRAIAKGVAAEIRSAYFGHDSEMNTKAYTDLTDVEGMARALKSDQE